MTEDLRRKLQDLQSLFDSGLLSAEDYAREKANLLAAWRQPPPAPAPTEPPLPLAPLPTVIALPLREYRDETHPVLKLWYACDSVELLLRLVVMLAVAEQTWRGPLEPALRRRLHDCGLEQPSLGAWRALADALVAPAPDAGALVPELPALLRDTLLPLLDGPVGSARTETTSFSALRNRLAHGGGIRRVLAERLVARWDAPFLDAMRHTAWLATVDLVVRDGRGGYGVLRGPTPQAQPYTPADPAALARAFAAGDAVALVRGDVALPLWPLALYGVPRGADPDAPPATELVPQVYVRRGEVRLQYNPLGADHLALSESEDAALHRFLELFRLVDETPAERTRRFTVRDFQDEIRQEARRLVGRASECAILAEALAATPEGVLWVWGTAGVGKSCLLAWLTAHQLAAPPRDTLVLPYRFRLGDERCNREAFLRFAGERLMAWLQLPDDPSAETMPPLRRLRETLARLDGKRVWFVLDGLDEIAALDPRFAGEVPLALAGPGIVWLCAGRPEAGLPAAFAGVRQPFPAGVPGMSEGDIRSLLLKRIGPLRKHLLRHDREQGERVGNPFVEQVARAADGLPLYVHYVIHDIFAGLYRVLDGHERLPPSLAAYHENLLRRLSVGSLQQVLTPLAATLAVAQEPLAAPALAALLRRRGKLVPEGAAGVRLVEHGLAAIATLLKRAPTPTGEDGYALYHLSLREHMATSAQSRDAVATAREALADLAVDVPPDPAAPYLYRHGIGHLLELRRTPEALALLTRFAYLMDRLRALLDPDGVLGISADWRATLPQSGPLAGDARLWEAFWREREHILRRGDARWPAYKILLQLAVEHADDSPVTRQAEAWLAAGNCDWVWLRNPQRIAHAAPNPCLRVLEGHTGPVNGAIVLANRRILSWSNDHILRLWNPDSGETLAVLEGVSGATVLADGRVLSWSRDKTLRLWEGVTGQPLAVLAGHTSAVHGATVLPDGRIMSWSNDETLRLWDSDSGQPLAVLAGHTSWVDATVLADGRILSWSDDHTLRLWEGVTGQPLAVLAGHTSAVHGATVLADGRILSWSFDHTLRLWDGTNGQPLAVLAEKHTSRVRGATVLPDGRVLSWSDDHTLRLWGGDNNQTLTVLEGHTYLFKGATVLPDGRILSWSFDHTLRLWNASNGVLLATLQAADVPWFFPNLHAAQATATNRGQLVTDHYLGWELWNTAVVSRLDTSPSQVMVWQTDSAVAAHALLEDGTLIITLASSYIFCLKLHRLKLHHGARRITLTELNALYEQQAN